MVGGSWSPTLRQKKAKDGAPTFVANFRVEPVFTEGS